MKLAAILVLLLTSAFSQVLELAGGSSSFSGVGGLARAYFPSSTLTIGVGSSYGHLAFGLSDTFKWHGFTVTAGDNGFGYSTEAGGVGLNVRGLTLERRSEHSNFAIFTGATGDSLSPSWLFATRARHAGSGAYYQYRRGRWKYSGLGAFSGGKHTVMAGASFSASRFHLTGAGGTLAGQKVFIGSAEYVPVQALHFVAAQQAYSWNGRHANVGSLSGFTSLGRWTASASIYNGSSAGLSQRGLAIGAGLTAGLLYASGSFYRSNGRALALQTVRIAVSPRWAASAAIVEGARSHSLSFGGSYRRNGLSVGIDHSVAFLAFGNRGFVQVTSVTLNFRIPHTDAKFDLAVAVLPTGRQYSASGNEFAKGPFATTASSEHRLTHRDNGGKFLIIGVVHDRAGLPVTGAAILLGPQVVFSNRSGQFQLRQKKAHTVPVKVDTEQFAAPGRWRVVSAPTVAGSEAIEIIVSQN